MPSPTVRGAWRVRYRAADRSGRRGSVPWPLLTLVLGLHDRQVGQLG
jgi:hypothetical protein